MFYDQGGQPYLVENSRGRKRYPGAKSLAQALKCRDRDFVDFLSRCLEWEPHRRLTPDQALQHRWITGSSLVAAPSPAGRMSQAKDHHQNGKHGRYKKSGKKGNHQKESFPPINFS
mmetsp:Transcript_15754/g.25662  ORF Transcript_15754/g.25662 Transcript_15754/m.25662 type:complete len:116 (-) Transcript_15754:457-804(-)